MKKILSVITTVSALVASSSALAKTEGNYVSFDVLRNKASHKTSNTGFYGDGEVGVNTVESSAGQDSYNDSAFGYGVTYKHAFNFNNVFIAPSVFFEKTNTVAKDSGNDQVKINSRHGAKIDLGYDVNDALAFYVTYGTAVVDYEVNYRLSGLGNDQGKASSSVSGVGLNYSFAKNLSVNFEFNRQNVNINSRFFGAGETVAGIDEYKTKTRITSYKVGLAYNF